jgi:hypothetical protein
MKTFNIEMIRADWYIATMVMESGKIYQGIGASRLIAVNELIKSYENI